MKVSQIIEKVEKEQPKLMAKLPKKRLEVLVQAVFDVARKTLTSAEDGVILIGGLGRFRVKMLEREDNGMKVMKRQILYLGVPEGVMGGDKKAARVPVKKQKKEKENAPE